MAAFFLLAAAVWPAAAPCQQYEFDSDAFRKKSFSIDGYAEVQPGLTLLNREASLFKLRYHGNPGDFKSLLEANLALLLDLSWSKGIFEFFAEPYADGALSSMDSSSALKLFQGYAALKPSAAFTAYLGKKSLKWGKGYAWSPTAFFERPKNPNEPDLSREGYWMVTADFTWSFPGPLKTLSWTPVVVPAGRNINRTFNPEDGLDFGFKLYGLLFDTDLDLYLLEGKGSPLRLGFDFSRNIAANSEIHGELAFSARSRRREIGRSGEILEKEGNEWNAVLGFRYLTAGETTLIAEYWHQGAGFGRDAMLDFHSLVDAGYEEYLGTGNDGLLRSAAALPAYTGFLPMRRYLFFRASRKDAWGILYLTPALTLIGNLADGSWSLAPEVAYKGMTNLELRLKTSVLAGKSYTEFGEKLGRLRLEFRARWFF